jgi:hypothetical protein
LLWSNIRFQWSPVGLHNSYFLFWKFGCGVHWSLPSSSGLHKELWGSEKYRQRAQILFCQRIHSKFNNRRTEIKGNLHATIPDASGSGTTAASSPKPGRADHKESLTLIRRAFVILLSELSAQQTWANSDTMEIEAEMDHL